eukprot:7157418-Prymnesium_polylepis.1
MAPSFSICNWLTWVSPGLTSGSLSEGSGIEVTCGLPGKLKILIGAQQECCTAGVRRSRSCGDLQHT